MSNNVDLTFPIFVDTKLPITVPETFVKTYIDDDKNIDSVNTLHTQLKKIIDNENIYTEELAFKEYQSKLFADRFKAEMRKRLMHVIANTIDTYDGAETEKELHLEFAEDRADFFTGRTADLRSIEKYIHDPEANHAIWYQCDSGTGKTSLLSKIYRNYKDTHNIICRFCGLTPDSSSGYSLMDSIWREMREYYPLRKWCHKDLPAHGHKSSFFQSSATEMFNIRLHQITEGKPLLILIDGLNQLEDNESDECFSLQWLDCMLCKNVRIILTSTVDNRIESGPFKHITISSLNPLPTKDLIDIVSGKLLEYGRTLSPTQNHKIAEVLKGSDQRPIYATLLANYLKDVASYDELPEIPSDLTGLLRLLFNNLTTGRDHDPELIKSAMSMLYCDRKGLSHSEMQKGLSADTQLMEHLRANAYHTIKGNRIPPILWSRLYNDIEPLCYIHHGQYGNLIKIYHEAIRSATQEIYLTDVFDRIAAYRHLSLLYKDWDTPHALQELNYCDFMCSAAIIQAYKTNKVDNSGIYERMHNTQFLHAKLIQDRVDLIKDIDMAIRLANYELSNEQVYLLKLKRDICQIYECSYQQFLHLCANAHPESSIRTLVPSKGILENELVSLYPYDLVKAFSKSSGSHPIISDDGQRILKLSSNNHKVIMENMMGLDDIGSYTLNTPIIDIKTTSDLKIHAFIVKDGAYIYDVENMKQIAWNSQITNAKWITISDNGTRWAYGNDKACYISGFGLQEWGCRTAKLSPSGRFFWYDTSRGIARVDLQTSDIRNVKLGYFKADADILELVAVEESSCILNNNEYISCLVLPDEGGFSGTRINYGSNHFFPIGGINERRFMVIDKYYGNCYIFEYDGQNINLLSETILNGIDAINSNLKHAYDSSIRLCYNLEHLLSAFKAYAAYNAGINTISCSNDGRLIAVTCGKNELADMTTEIYIVHDGIGNKVNLHNEIESSYLMSCAVSPDGDCIWVSASEADDNMLCLSPSGKVLARIPNAGKKLAMRFTPDGRYLIAVNGHHIASETPLFHIIDTANNNIAKQFIPDKDNDNYVIDIKTSDDMAISKDGKYAIFDTAENPVVVHLATGQILSIRDANKIVGDNMSQSDFTVSKSGDITYSLGSTELCAYVPGIYMWKEIPAGLAVVSVDGRVYFFRRPEFEGAKKGYFRNLLKGIGVFKSR